MAVATTTLAQKKKKDEDNFVGRMSKVRKKTTRGFLLCPKSQQNWRPRCKKNGCYFFFDKKKSDNFPIDKEKYFPFVASK